MTIFRCTFSNSAVCYWLPKGNVFEIACFLCHPYQVISKHELKWEVVARQTTAPRYNAVLNTPLCGRFNDVVQRHAYLMPAANESRWRALNSGRVPLLPSSQDYHSSRCWIRRDQDRARTRVLARLASMGLTTI